MRFSVGVAAALLSLSVEAGSVELPYTRSADNVIAGIPPPPGTYVPVPTFFSTNSTKSKDGATSYPLDLDTQVAYSVYLANAGIAGFAIFGSTGEPIHVTPDERNKVISATRKALDKAGHKNYPIIAGVVSQQFEEAIDLLNQAKRAGAQWGVCLVPGVRNFQFPSASFKIGSHGFRLEPSLTSFSMPPIVMIIANFQCCSTLLSPHHSRVLLTGLRLSRIRARYRS